MGPSDIAIIVLLAVSAGALAYAFFVMTPPHEDFRRAKWLFGISALTFAAVGPMWAIDTSQHFYIRAAVCGIVGAIALIAFNESLRLVAHRGKAALDQKMQSAMVVSPPRKSKTELKIEEANALAELERQRNIAREKTARSDFERHRPLTPAARPSPKSTPSVSVANSPGSIIAPSGGTNTIINPIVRDADGLYQGDSKVGRVQGPHVDGANSIIDFQIISFTAYPNPDAPLEYGDFLIQCAEIPRQEPNTFVGQLFASVIGARCKIVGRK